MANTFVTPTAVARAGTFRLRNNLVMANLMFRGHEVEWNTPPAIGSSVTIRRPATFSATNFSSTYTASDATEDSVTLTLAERPYVKVVLTPEDLTLNLNDFMFQIGDGAMLALSEYIDAFATALYDEVYYYVGTAGDPPDALADIVAVGTEADTRKWPVSPRVAVINATAKGDLLGVSEMVHAEKRSDGGEAFRNASMGHAYGFDWFMDQNIKTHTSGTGSGYLVNDASAAIGDTTVTADTGTGTILKGDIVTIVGDSDPYVVTSALSGGSFGIDPAARVAFADNAAITVVNASSSHVANLAFHPLAFALAVVPPVASQGANSSTVFSDGLGVRVTFDFDNTTGNDVAIFETFVGGVCQQPELALRIFG